MQRGDLTALIGPNGAGKTTLFNIMAGALAPTAGQVHFLGQPVRHTLSACRMGIARTFQNIRLFCHMTVLENVLAAMGGLSWSDLAFGTRAGRSRERLRMKRAYYLLEEMGLAGECDRMAEDLPFGMQRLLEIARAMATEPHLLLLDEPAAGLNLVETRRLAELIAGIHARGVTVLLIEHDMHMVMSLVQRVLVLDEGRLIADGSPGAVRNNPAVCAAYLGVEGTVDV
jgi:branched-chain amino acid transport system permease protein